MPHSVSFSIKPGQPRHASYLRAAQELARILDMQGTKKYHLRPAVLTHAEEHIEHYRLTAYEGARPESCGCTAKDCRKHGIVPGMVLIHGEQ